MILSCVLFFAIVIGNEGCLTPTNKTGDCRNLKNCSVLVEILRQNQSTGSALVKESICGFEGLDPLVCCPVTNHTSGVPQESLTEFSDERLKEDQCGQFYYDTADKIVGGDDANLGEWPWLAALGYKSFTSDGVRWLCGGVLVSRRHVMTAAHCINIPSSKKLKLVRFGDLNLDEGVADGAAPVDVEVDKIFPHLEYSIESKVNDIAIIRLKNDVPFCENIRPICLPNTSYFKSNSLANKTVKVAGWGNLEFGGKSTDRLQQVDLKVIDDDTCKKTYSSFSGVIIDSRVMCAGTPGKSACQGDSGGPLVLVHDFKHYLVGLVSYGKGCGSPGYPGVATRVSSFGEWITAHLT